jgi:hypothetical protein
MVLWMARIEAVIARRPQADAAISRWRCAYVDGDCFTALAMTTCRRGEEKGHGS